MGPSSSSRCRGGWTLRVGVGILALFLMIAIGVERGFAASPPWLLLPEAPPGWILTGHSLYRDLYGSTTYELLLPSTVEEPQDADGDGLISDREAIRTDQDEELDSFQGVRISDRIVTSIAAALLVQFHSGASILPSGVVTTTEELIPIPPLPLDLPDHYDNGVLVPSTVREVKFFVLRVLLGDLARACQMRPWWLLANRRQLQDPAFDVVQYVAEEAPGIFQASKVGWCPDVIAEIEVMANRERDLRELRRDLRLVALGQEVVLDGSSAASVSGLRTFDLLGDLATLKSVLMGGMTSSMMTAAPLEAIDYASGEQCDGPICPSTCRIPAPEFCGDGALQRFLGEECDDGDRDGGDGCSAYCQREGEYCGDGELLYDVDADQDGSPESTFTFEACEDDDTVGAETTGRECPTGDPCLTALDCTLGGLLCDVTNACGNIQRYCPDGTTCNDDADCVNAQPQRNSCRYRFDGLCTYSLIPCVTHQECWSAIFCDTVTGTCSNTPARLCSRDADCTWCTYEEIWGICPDTGERCASDEACDGGYCRLDTSGICRPRDLGLCNQFCSEELSCGDGIVATDENGSIEECDPGRRCDDGMPCAPGQTCRDGSACGVRPTPTCTAACHLLRCGDGVIADASTECAALVSDPELYQACLQFTEECDDGNATDFDGCTRCIVDRCGDGIHDCQPTSSTGPTCTNERCDDGGWCGGRLGEQPCQRDWQCPPYRHCLDSLRPCTDHSDCRGSVCVSGASGDTCVPLDQDGCSTSCETEFCGDGVAQTAALGRPLEECDTGTICIGGFNAGLDCTGDPGYCVCPPSAGSGCVSGGCGQCGGGCMGCMNVQCGNGIPQGPGVNCRFDPPTFLGDDEECDDGNTSDDDGCSATCKVERCLNNFIEPEGLDGFPGTADDEECEPPWHCGGVAKRCTENGWPCVNSKPAVGPFPGCTCTATPTCTPGSTCTAGSCEPACAAGCNMNCKIPESCGENCFVDCGEECEDGNATSGDGCSANCEIEYCGDGSVNLPFEQCDPPAWPIPAATHCCGSGVCGGATGGSGGSGGSTPCDGSCIPPPGTCMPWCRQSVCPCIPPNPCPTAASCGDGCWQAGEECEDCNATDGDGCSGACEWEYCGDGAVNLPFEECDAGFVAPTCPPGPSAGLWCTGGGSCTYCLDVQMGDCRPGCTGSTAEECDDGNASSGDGCSASGEIEFCGDGVVNMGEGCDPGATCPDGTACGSAGGCPNGGSCISRCEYDSSGNPTCSGDCHEVVCGDGIRMCSEECDDRNSISGDGCSAACKQEFCGDGYPDVDGPDEKWGERNIDEDRNGTVDDFSEWLWPGSDDEGCDDGWENSDTEVSVTGGIACRTNCRIARCGDGVVDEDEQCDVPTMEGGALCDPRISAPACENRDGDTGACSADCLREGCGDGIVQEEFGEECDTGGRVNGDATLSTCTIRDPDVGVTQSCLPMAGDGDDCDARCQWDFTPLCGNGLLDPGEECDTVGLCPNDTPCVRTKDCGLGICDPVTFACSDGSPCTVTSDCYRLCRTCASDCTFALPLCGDGVTDSGEECDDGNIDPGDGCTFCLLDRPDLCGNAEIDPGEACDPGELTASLECTVLCQFPLAPAQCGDWRVNNRGRWGDELRELLDRDYGRRGSEGFGLQGAFPAVESIEPGWYVIPASPEGTCATAPSGSCPRQDAPPPLSVCGNGRIESPEECDSGILTNGTWGTVRTNEFQWWRALWSKAFRPWYSYFYGWWFNYLGYWGGNWWNTWDWSGYWHPGYWGSSSWSPYWSWWDGYYGYSWYYHWNYWYYRQPVDFLGEFALSSCSSQCTLQQCGNGRIDLGETCDDVGKCISPFGAVTGVCPSMQGCPVGDTCAQRGAIAKAGQLACSANCQLPFPAFSGVCGDGDLNWWLGEECDDGGYCLNSGATCTTANASTTCSGNPCIPRDFDGCSDACEREEYSNDPADCGDGAVYAYDEECDDGGWCGIASVTPSFIPPVPAGSSSYCQTNPCPTRCTKRDAWKVCPGSYPDCIPVDGSPYTAATPPPSDGCTASCLFTPPSCGDRRVDLMIGEECDPPTPPVSCPPPPPASCPSPNPDPAAHDNNLCQSDCTLLNSLSKCGDGIRDEFELCDTGLDNRDEANSCKTTCVPPICGDFFIDRGETCDDGVTFTCADGSSCNPVGAPCGDGSACNDRGGDGCQWCQVELCGNGGIDLGENCDDGNRTDGDGCSYWCLREETCGNGHIESGEECDDGNTLQGDGCTGPDAIDALGNPTPCTVEECGDGVLQPGIGEQCDEGASANLWDPNRCRPTCELPRCGDDVDLFADGGIVDDERGEACDDGKQCIGGTRNGQACVGPTDCKGSPCEVRDGDGCSLECLIEFGWKRSSASDPHSLVESCGDDVLDPGEECDDDDTAGGDGCSAVCLLEHSEDCGDGILENTSTGSADHDEECDDGNRLDRDGCTATCQLEWVRCGTSACSGDAFLCADGTSCFSGDQTLPCTDESICRLVPECVFACSFGWCGNGRVDAGEECDDGCNEGLPGVCEQQDDDDVCTRFCQARQAISSGTVLQVQRFVGRPIGSGEVLSLSGELLETNLFAPNLRSIDDPLWQSPWSWGEFFRRDVSLTEGGYTEALGFFTRALSSANYFPAGRYYLPMPSYVYYSPSWYGYSPYAYWVSGIPYYSYYAPYYYGYYGPYSYWYGAYRPYSWYSTPYSWGGGYGYGYYGSPSYGYGYGSPYSYGYYGGYYGSPSYGYGYGSPYYYGYYGLYGYWNGYYGPYSPYYYYGDSYPSYYYGYYSPYSYWYHSPYHYYSYLPHYYSWYGYSPYAWYGYNPYYYRSYYTSYTAVSSQNAQANSIGGNLRSAVSALATARLLGIMPTRTSVSPLEPTGIEAYGACQEQLPQVSIVTQLPSPPRLELPPYLPGDVVRRLEELICGTEGVPRQLFMRDCTRTFARVFQGVRQSTAQATVGLQAGAGPFSLLRDRLLRTARTIGYQEADRMVIPTLQQFLASLAQELAALRDLLREFERLSFTEETCPFTGPLCSP